MLNVAFGSFRCELWTPFPTLLLQNFRFPKTTSTERSRATHTWKLACMHGYARICTFGARVHRYVCMQAREQPLTVFRGCCQPYPLPLIWLQSKLPGQRVPGVFGPLPPQNWAYKCIPCARHFFLKKKYRLWGLNLDPHACKARQALYWVITPVPENQNVINISSAYFVSPRGCTDGEVLSSSLKKKKKFRNAETENNSRASMVEVSPFLLVSGIFFKYFASNNQGKYCPELLQGYSRVNVQEELKISIWRLGDLIGKVSCNATSHISSYT